MSSSRRARSKRSYRQQRRQNERAVAALNLKQEIDMSNKKIFMLELTDDEFASMQAIINENADYYMARVKTTDTQAEAIASTQWLKANLNMVVAVNNPIISEVDK